MIVNKTHNSVNEGHDALTHIENYDRGILGSSSNPEARFVRDFEDVKKYVDALRTIGMHIVLTSGTFDLLHVGHARYLEIAKSYGDVLVVGVDSDEKVKARKGPDRPVVPETERVRMLSHLRSVDMLTVKPLVEKKWELIKLINPDTLIVTAETYDDRTLTDLDNYCEKVVVLPPQATTSTSAQIRKLQLGWTSDIIEPISQVLEECEVSDEAKEKIGKLLTGLSVRKSS